MKIKAILLTVVLSFFLFGFLVAQDKTLKLHLRGVMESTCSLQPLSGPDAGKIIQQKEQIKNGESAIFTVTKSQLPGEFILRFNFKQTLNSTPYPVEKIILINEEDLELWVNPLFYNNEDSTYFQKNEVENTLRFKLLNELAIEKKSLNILQNFLLNYEEINTLFLKEGNKEFEKLRIGFNQWLKMKQNLYPSTFAVKALQVEYTPKMLWKGTAKERLEGMMDHYFDEMDFKDTLLIKTEAFKEWINRYINNYTQLSNTTRSRDSLLTVAAKIAIEKSRKGNGLVYGWMVDYFYNGFEQFNIASGLLMLEPYLNDPLCLTSKKGAIQKRITGIRTLVKGVLAPDFKMLTDADKGISFLNYATDSKYKLVIFWSAGCGHCEELLKKLYSYTQNESNKKLLDVFALSVDETATEIEEWKTKINMLKSWHHIRVNGGVNSKEANDYFVLSTPTMFLVDSKTNLIASVPDTFEQLESNLIGIKN
ncbi:MAG: DUF5106 domain-containing protein [Ferruginibacter sp.]|nr:DUF5106 domain-containing protein [Ferruginibacter sp.]